MPRMIVDDETLLEHPLSSGRRTKNKRDLFKRAAVIMRFVALKPGSSTNEISKQTYAELEIQEKAVNEYVRALEDAGLIKNQPFDVKGTKYNSWYLPDWLPGSDQGKIC